MGPGLGKSPIRNLRLIADAGALAFAFLVVPRIAMGVWLDPIPAIIGMASGAICIRGPKADESTPWRRLLAVQCGICAAVAFIWCWLYRFPVAVLWFAPVWISLSAVIVSVALIASSQGSNPQRDRLISFALRLGGLLRSADACLNKMPAAFIVGTAPPIGVYGALAMLVPGTSPFHHEALGIVIFGWLALWGVAFWRLHWLDSLLGVLLPLISAAALLLTISGGTLGHPNRLTCVWFGWSAVLIVFYRCATRSAARSGAAQDLSETVRLLLIAGCAAWLMKGFLSPNLQGTGDARGYATMLEDAVLQARAHGFPVWAGESPYRFNGAIYPIRVAPAFQHLGALLDLATFRALPLITLMNLLLFAVGVGAAMTTYYAAGTVLGGRRWAAAALAVVYLACPGVLELPNNGDLYMSWMAVPLVSVAFFAAARNAMRPGWSSTLVLAGALGCCWWGHSPIAMWTTVAVFLIQGVGLLVNRPSHGSYIILGVGVILYLAIAAYPIGSVLLYPPDPGASSGTWQRSNVSSIVGELRGAFPAVLLPVSPKGLIAGNFQLGYTLWAIFFASLFCMRRPASGVAMAVLAVGAGVIILLNPIPVLQDGLWTLVPAAMRNITGDHAASRLYVQLASACIVAGATVLSSASPRAYRVALLGLLVGAGWSILEANNFSPPEWDFRHASGPDTSDAIMRTENTMVTRFAYIIFPKAPANYSDGVVAPELEYRLLRRGDYSTLLEGKAAAAMQSHTLGLYDFVRALDGLPWLEIPQPLVLSPGRHYILGLEPNSESGPVTGVLQLKGPSMLREYLLPAMGGDRAFGLGGSHSPYVAIWTSLPVGETIQVRFIPQGMTVDQVDHFAKLRFGEYDPAKMPVQVGAWMPYQAQVQADEACWLETPRNFQAGYAASVDGVSAQVRKSPEGLVMVPVPRGTSEVEVRYVAPIGLRMLFLLSVLCIAALLALLAARMAAEFIL
jgi:hypothetical protein